LRTSPHTLERVETVVGALTGVLGLITLVWRDWIEAVFRVDPDHGNGEVEWLVVAVLAIVSITCFALARRERRHLATSIE
jgi:hypothetical protein